MFTFLNCYFFQYFVGTSDTLYRQESGKALLGGGGGNCPSCPPPPPLATLMFNLIQFIGWPWLAHARQLPPRNFEAPCLFSIYQLHVIFLARNPSNNLIVCVSVTRLRSSAKHIPNQSVGVWYKVDRHLQRDAIFFWRMRMRQGQNVRRKKNIATGTCTGTCISR